MERLERVEILYRGLTDIDENIKFECDAEGRLVYGNDNLYHLFNATEDELLGEGWANFLHPDSLSMLADWKRQVETNKIAFGSFKIIQRGTGDVYEISYKAKIYRDKKSDQPLHVVGQSTAVQIKE